MKQIDLGKTQSPMEVSPLSGKKSEKNKKFYPSVYLSDVKGLELPEGEFNFTGRGRTTRVTEDIKNGTSSIEFDLLSMCPEGPCEVSEDDDLEDTMDKMMSDKEKVMDEEDEEE